MVKEIYMSKRKALVDEAQTLLDNGDMEKFNDKMKEIEELDAQFEAQATAQANLNAVSGSSVVQAPQTGTVSTSGEIYDSMEYRKAFMNYVTQGTAIPAEFSGALRNVTTKTTDVAPVIPTTTLNRIIERMETVGDILKLVTRTSYKGAVAIPTSSVKPTATWAAEGSGVAVQKTEVDGTIIFAYHKLKIAVSMTLEVQTMSLSAFETKFVKDVADAMVKALEAAIISGDGVDKPKGILAETPVSGQAIEIASGTALSYDTLIEAEAALPVEYEGGARWCMTKKTFMAFYGMTDDSGQPIARINYGIDGKPERIFNGRPVAIVSGLLPNYTTTVSADTTFAFIFDFADYILNTNHEITAKVYEDHDTDDVIRKAVMLVDGKVVDKNSLVTLTVKA